MNDQPQVAVATANDQAQLPPPAELKKKISSPNDGGLVGVLLGSNKQTVPTNAAFILAILLIVVLVVAMFAPVDPSVDRQSLLTTLFSTLTAVIGFILGRKI